MSELQRHDFYQEVARFIEQARSQTYKAINFTMVQAYWHIGRLIVEEEQRGETRAG